MDVWQARADETDAVGQLLHDFNVEYDDPTPSPAELAARIRELIADGDTTVLLGGPDRNQPHAVAVMRFRKAIWSTSLECYLAELYVVTDQRGRGLGRAVITAAVEHARTRGADYMDLGTSEADIAARGLYESLGFTRTEGRPNGPINYYYERDLGSA